jgi:KAP family P-loop domain
MTGKKLLLDAPTENPALGYRQIASAFAEVITQSTPNFAIGIFGGWGSGKTTLMTAINASLPKDEFVAVNFNAWRFEREPQLLIPLLDTIRAELVRHAKRKPETGSNLYQITGRLGKVVRALAKGLSGSVGLPGAITVNYNAGQALDALSELSAEQDSLKPESLYVAAFQELQDSFTHLAGAGINGIVVFVDDLDRCLPGHALDVLESMKLFFDLTGFVFVVGLDEDVIDRAVLAKFATETSSYPAEDEQASATMTSLTERLGREYAKKIFQVPYSLPTMLPRQLTELLSSMYEEAGIEGEQLADLRGRVRPYVNLIAVERRVNPREVKRFINSYTLQTLIRPELDPDVILALQALAFRRDWEDAYDAINADSELFIGALRSYRTGYGAAFEDTLPELRRFPPDLNTFLRSSLAKPLVARPSLDAYLSSLRSTRGSGAWIFDFFHALGRVERAVAGALASQAAKPDISMVLQALDNFRNTEVKGSNKAIAEKIREIYTRLAGLASELSSIAPTDEASTIPTLQNLATDIDQFKAELRFIRDAEIR